MKRMLVTLCAGVVIGTGTAAATTLLPGIRSPTGNISCFLVSGGPELLLCSIAHSSYANALQAKCMGPDGSGVDWHGFTLGPAKGSHINCTGGILYDNGKYAELPHAAVRHVLAPHDVYVQIAAHRRDLHERRRTWGLHLTRVVSTLVTMF